MSIVYFTTWTTYGAWLPGDDRGWYQRSRGLQLPNPLLAFSTALQMTESALILNADQRQLVEKTIREHCRIRQWELHAVNCRSNHVHVVVAAPRVAIEIPREQFKAWATRKLKERDRATTPRGHEERDNWWTERGWDEYVDGDQALAEVVRYVMECQ